MFLQKEEYKVYRAANPGHVLGNVEAYGGTFTNRRKEQAQFYVDYWAKRGGIRVMHEITVLNPNQFYLHRDNAWDVCEALYSQYGDDRVLEEYDDFFLYPRFLVEPELVEYVKSRGYNIIAYIGEFDDDDGGTQDVVVLLDNAETIYKRI